ncbi:MAG: IS66 family insertion sequence element accessory protein TnpB [Pirellulales bacterium]
MLNLSGSARIFVYSLPTDMRRQFDGLSALVTHTLEHDIFAGDYFVFFNRSRTLCKILRWEKTGYEMFAKRLERGTYRRPECDAGSLATLVDALTMAMVLGGVDPAATRRRKRYQRPESSSNWRPTDEDGQVSRAEHSRLAVC